MLVWLLVLLLLSADIYVVYRLIFANKIISITLLKYRE